MVKKIDEKYMHIALEEAKGAKADGELPFGAVVVYKGKIVGRGRCREARRQTVLAHAELEAVDGACHALGTNNLSGCTIYATNEPCPMCAAAIFQAKIAYVVVGASRSDLPFVRPRKINLETLATDSGYDVTITRGVYKKHVLNLFDLS
jgi:tRNA(Arg) A34 adenosine deaminase TadA